MSAIITTPILHAEYFTGIKPLKDFPEGRTKVRVRAGEFVAVYVKSGTTLRGFYVIEKDGHWYPGPEFAINHTYPNDKH